ncbi:MAG TPA: hypothetical protein VK167_02860 [Flavipsychrobacter sp.]|nr:hypothetical protein [Flavipsychrobacter sp.]
MIDSGTISEVISDLSNNVKSNEKLLYVLIGLLVTDIILTLIKVYFDFRLKSLDKKIYRANIIEDNSVQITAKIFKELNDLTYILPNSAHTIIPKIITIERFYNDNLIFINSDILPCIREICDYFKSVAGDYRKKNYQTEATLFRNFIQKFQK